MSDCTAFVLAGGKSSRMGSDKAFIEFEGRTLLSRALDLAHAVCPVVGIVGQPDKFSQFGQVVPDIYRERGPLGGIHAALRSTTTDLNLMLAVDTPFLRADFIRMLLEKMEASDALVTVPRVNADFQPLCAVYRREFAASADAALRTGRNKIGFLFTPEITQIVEEDEIRRLDFPLQMFDNLNTREELEQARADLRTK